MDYTLLENYVICFLLGIGIIVFFLRDFILAWWRVKRSGGRKILVKIKNPLQDYYRAGTVDNGYLKFTARKRKDNPYADRMINISKIFDRAVYKSFGVMCIDVDDEKNFVYYMSEDTYKGISGYNAELNDETVRTALAKPSLQDGLLTNRMFQLVVIIGLAACVVMGYMILKNIGTLDIHLKMVYEQTTPIFNKMFNATQLP